MSEALAERVGRLEGAMEQVVPRLDRIQAGQTELREVLSKEIGALYDKLDELYVTRTEFNAVVSPLRAWVYGMIGLVAGAFGLSIVNHFLPVAARAGG